MTTRTVWETLPEHQHFGTTTDGWQVIKTVEMFANTNIFEVKFCDQCLIWTRRWHNAEKFRQERQNK